MYLCMHAFVFVYVYYRIQLCMYICTYMIIYVYTYIYTCTYLLVAQVQHVFPKAGRVLELYAPGELEKRMGRILAKAKESGTQTVGLEKAKTDQRAQCSSINEHTSNDIGPNMM